MVRTAATSLSPEELARYSRHILLPGIGVEGQTRLARSRVLVVGLGGLGSPAALYLAAAGVGTLGLADLDSVEDHNLQRQVIHDTASIGHLKVTSAARRLAALNPHVRVETHPHGVSAANAIELFAAYDLVVDGTDNFGTRYLNNDAAVLARRPLVYGSLFQFEGQVSVFDPARGAPCYRCLFPAPPPPGSVPNCAEAGVFGALCGVIGSFQAMEAVKILAGIGEPLHGRLLVVDALGAATRTLRLKPDPSCPCCGTHATIRTLDAARYTVSCAPDHSAPKPMPAPHGLPDELHPRDAHAALASGGALLLDVREPHELAICRIAGSTDIPMRTLPSRLHDLPRDRAILVLCHHGGRSDRVARFLRQQGFDRVANVTGGIDAWALSVDPSLRRY